MKLLYKKLKYRQFNKHKIEKLKREYRRKKQKRRKYLTELEEYHKFVATHEVVTFPERLYLASEDEAIFDLIKAAEEKDNIYLDFSKTKFIDIGSSIYIRAFIDHLNDEKKRYKILC